MSDAMHFAEELTGRFCGDRAGLPAQAISEVGHLSCVANDFGYEQVFARCLRSHGRTGNCLLAISTSGTSPRPEPGWDPKGRTDHRLLHRVQLLRRFAAGTVFLHGYDVAHVSLGTLQSLDDLGMAVVQGGHLGGGRRRSGILPEEIIS